MIHEYHSLFLGSGSSIRIPRREIKYIMPSLLNVPNANNVPYKNIPCNTAYNNTAYPTLTFYFGGQPFTVTSLDYILPGRKSGMCRLKIGITPNSQWTFGHVFLSRKMYTIYDFETKFIGFAKPKHD